MASADVLHFGAVGQRQPTPGQENHSLLRRGSGTIWVLVLFNRPAWRYGNRRMVLNGKFKMTSRTASSAVVRSDDIACLVGAEVDRAEGFAGGGADGQVFLLSANADEFGDLGVFELQAVHHARLGQ